MSKTALPEQPTKITGERTGARKAERSAAALRDNLKRRKAQQRARDEPDRGPTADGSAADDGAATEPAGRRKP